MLAIVSNLTLLSAATSDHLLLKPQLLHLSVCCPLFSKGQGQGQVVSWYHPMNNSTHLPPKSPGYYSMFEGSSLFQGGSIFKELANFPSRGGGGSGGHKRTPSAGYLPQLQPSSWLEEILESADDGDGATTSKGSHRRSSSDSATFSESPYQFDSIVNPFTAEEEYYARDAPGAHTMRREISDYNRLDEEQLVSVLAKMKPFQRQQPKRGAEGGAIIHGMSVTNLVRPSASGDNKNLERGMKHLPRNSLPTSSANNNNTVVWEKPRKQNATNLNTDKVSESNSHSEGSNDDQRVGLGKCKSEPEVQSTSECDRSYQGQQQEEAPTSSEQLGLSLDPKKAKRILANRQSAQRSRVRKLQYISQLETSVNALQAEVTTLLQQVDLYDHQRAILTAENVLLKQKLTSLGQTQRFKEAHHEALKKDVQRLWYQQRHLQLPPLSPTGYDVQQQQQFSKLDLDPQQQQQQLPSLSPIGYEVQQQQFSKLDLGSHQQQHQQLSPLSPTGYELQRLRFSKLNLGSQQQQRLPLSPIP